MQLLLVALPHPQLRLSLPLLFPHQPLLRLSPLLLPLPLTYQLHQPLLQALLLLLLLLLLRLLLLGLCLSRKYSLYGMMTTRPW